MQPTPSDISALNYEKAFAELEAIVNGLETNSKTLEEAIALFERGQALAQHCATLLNTAELRVQQLSQEESFPSGGAFFDDEQDENL